MHKLRVMALQHILQSLGGVHPLQPFLAIHLFIEVSGEESVCTQSPAQEEVDPG
jgi:hypothetical protein